MSDKTTSPRDTYEQFQHPSLLSPVWQLVKWIEMALTIGSLVAAMWQVVLLDRSLIVDAAIWSIPALLAAFGALRRRSTPLGRSLATAYLFTLAIGIWIARTPGVLPDLGNLNNDTDPFHQVWTRLPLISRRILGWNIAASGFFLFIFLGYWVCYIPLRNRRAGRPAEISPAICYLGLAVLWGIPLLGAFGVLMIILFG